MSRNAVLWIVWIVATLVAGGALAGIMFVGGPRDLFLVGETTGAHRQIELACETCHTSPVFADAAKIAKDMTKACLTCHDDELKAADDSHPVKKFRDPRNADRRAVLDALYCTTCHAEHVPEITRPMAVTVPRDYCLACHDDVGKNRPTHAGLGFETCASAGCHNYHDNSALYEDFLARHAGMPDLAAHPVAPLTAISRATPPLRAALEADDPVAALRGYLETLGRPAPEPAEAEAALAAVLVAADAVAPERHLTADAVAAWAGSGHALAGINCGGCHAPEAGEAPTPEAVAAAWIEAPGLEVCAACHKPEAKGFVEGRHGMRLHPELAAPRKAPSEPWLAPLAGLFADRPLPTMTVGGSDLPMKPEARDRTVEDCGACHAPHAVDLKVAAGDACLACHDDGHSRAWVGSPHHRLWEAEIAGTAPPGSGVACADCHMPKRARGDGFVTEHNQNATLRPNEKMIRPVCTNCHGVAFAIDALADPDLVENNFNGAPSTHVPGIDWAKARAGGTQ